MKQSKAEIILRDPGKYAHHDRIFLNNPVIMQGMGLAPVVILATSGRNALMLAVAVALLLTPSRVLSFWISRSIRSFTAHICIWILRIFMRKRALKAMPTGSGSRPRRNGTTPFCSCSTCSRTT